MPGRCSSKSECVRHRRSLDLVGVFLRSRVWHLKETFNSFWEYSYEGSAQRFVREWYAKAIRSKLEPIKAVAQMLRARLQELLNYITHPITNATSEGFNALIQNIKANA